MFAFFFLMIRQPPKPTPFPSTPLSRPRAAAATAEGNRARHQDDSGIQEGKNAALHHASIESSRGPDSSSAQRCSVRRRRRSDRKSTRLNSSHQIISYAVFCLKKKTRTP